MMIVVGGRAFTFAEPQISLERVVAISALKDLNLELLPTATEQNIHHLGAPGYYTASVFNLNTKIHTLDDSFMLHHVSIT